MNKTWTRIVIVVIAAAAVAFWVFFDRQRAPERQMDNALNAMPAWQVIKEQEPALHQRILDQMAALQKRASRSSRLSTPSSRRSCICRCRVCRTPLTPTW